MHIPSEMTRLRHEFQDQLVVPLSHRQRVLQACHDDIFSAHLGFEKTRKNVSQRFFWPNLKHTVIDYVRHCPDCQTKKNPPQAERAPMVPIPVSGIPKKSPQELPVIGGERPLDLGDHGRRSPLDPRHGQCLRCTGFGHKFTVCASLSITERDMIHDGKAGDIRSAMLRHYAIDPKARKLFSMMYDVSVSRPTTNFIHTAGSPLLPSFDLSEEGRRGLAEEERSGGRGSDRERRSSHGRRPML